MKKLFELVKERNQFQSELKKETDLFKVKKDNLEKKIRSLLELENVAQTGINVELVQLAESVMYVHGDPYGNTDDGGSYLIASAAVNDIAQGCPHLKNEFYGNKTYSGYYQRYDCGYGYGPSHGSIKDEIGLKDEARKRELTDEEKDACIYYLKNFKAIRQAKKDMAVS